MFFGMAFSMVYALHKWDLVFIIGNFISVFLTLILAKLLLKYRRSVRLGILCPQSRSLTARHLFSFSRFCGDPHAEEESQDSYPFYQEFIDCNDEAE